MYNVYIHIYIYVYIYIYILYIYIYISQIKTHNLSKITNVSIIFRSFIKLKTKIQITQQHKKKKKLKQKLLHLYLSPLFSRERCTCNALFSFFIYFVSCSLFLIFTLFDFCVAIKHGFLNIFPFKEA